MSLLASSFTSCDNFKLLFVSVILLFYPSTIYTEKKQFKLFVKQTVCCKAFLAQLLIYSGGKLQCPKEVSVKENPC